MTCILLGLGAAALVLWPLAPLAFREKVVSDLRSPGVGPNTVAHWSPDWIEGVPLSDGDVPWTVSFSGATW